MNPFIVVGYYTHKTIYEDFAKAFIDSLRQYNVPYYVERIDDLGSWRKNTIYKPTFIKKMLLQFNGFDIVYVDVDAEFFDYPELFNGLKCDIAVYELDRKRCWGKRQKGLEVLSGTIFLRNDKKVLDIVERWEKECQKNPSVWDQKSLEKVLAGDFYRLPGEYCKIFDRMNWIKNPVILHYQASRRMRRKKLIVKRKHNSR